MKGAVPNQHFSGYGNVNFTSQPGVDRVPSLADGGPPLGGSPGPEAVTSNGLRAWHRDGREQTPLTPCPASSTKKER